MSITPTTPTSAAAAAASPGIAAAKLDETLNNFLRLLTTQLKYQDPVSPMDATEFTSQLVSFTGVEQQIAQNRKLDTLISLQSGGRFGDAINYLGYEVETQNGVFRYDGEPTELTYETPAGAESLTVQIVDSRNSVVWTGEGSTDAGRHSIAWDGRTASGAAAPDGIYSMRLIGRSKEGEAISGTSYTRGRVTGVETRDGEVKLMLGTIPVSMADVLSVRTPAN